MKTRVSVCSPYKTATTAVGQAIVDLGVGSAMMPYRKRLFRRMRSEIVKANRLADSWPGTVEGFVDEYSVEITERFAPFMKRTWRFDIFHDAPFGHSHFHPMVLLALFPGIRLVWVERGYPEWLDSVERWERSHPRLYRGWRRWDTDRTKIIRSRIKQRQLQLGRFQRVRMELPDQCLFLPLEDFATYDVLAAFFGVESLPGAPARLNASSGQ